MSDLQGCSSGWQPPGPGQCWATQRAALIQVMAPQTSQQVCSQTGEAEAQGCLLRQWEMQPGCLGGTWSSDVLVKPFMMTPALMWSHLGFQQQWPAGCRYCLLAALLLHLSVEAVHPCACAEDKQAGCQSRAGGFQQPQQG